jgi:hypothetical protein
MKKTSTAYCCFAVLIALLALLPGCGCGDDAQHEPLLANVSDPCAPPPVSAAGAVQGDRAKRLYPSRSRERDAGRREACEIR